MSDEQDRHLEITPAAQQVITAMQHRVAAIGDEYGEGSPEHVEALTSLVGALATCFGSEAALPRRTRSPCMA